MVLDRRHRSYVTASRMTTTPSKPKLVFAAAPLAIFCQRRALVFRARSPASSAAGTRCYAVSVTAQAVRLCDAAPAAVLMQIVAPTLQFSTKNKVVGPTAQKWRGQY